VQRAADGYPWVLDGYRMQRRLACAVERMYCWICVCGMFSVCSIKDLAFLHGAALQQLHFK